MTMKIQDYKEIVATPQAHLEFLQHVTGLMDGIDEVDAATAARKLHTALRETVEVGGVHSVRRGTCWPWRKPLATCGSRRKHRLLCSRM